MKDLFLKKKKRFKGIWLQFTMCSYSLDNDKKKKNKNRRRLELTIFYVKVTQRHIYKCDCMKKNHFGAFLLDTEGGRDTHKITIFL